MSVKSVSRSLKRMNRETVAIYVLLAVLVVLVVYFVMKNREGFNSNSQRVVIYFFYVDWCPHCTKAKPVVEQVQQQYANNNQVEVRAVDCEAPENRELVQENNVGAYPTVKANNGEEMESAINQETLVAFIEQQLKQGN